MPCICGSLACDCQIRLETALAALREFSRILSESVFSAPDEQVEKYFTKLRAAKSTLFEALDSYKAPAASRQFKPV
jgi:hypothetical protein